MKRAVLLILFAILGISYATPIQAQKKWNFVGDVGMLLGSQNRSIITLQAGAMRSVKPWVSLYAGAAYDMSLTSEEGDINRLRIPLTAKFYAFQHKQMFELAPFVSIYPSYDFSQRTYNVGAQGGLDVILWGIRIGVAWMQPFLHGEKGIVNYHVGFDIGI